MNTVRVVEPSELTAAVVTGTAVAWVLLLLGMPPFPAVLVGMGTCATICGTYRRRWSGPPSPGRRPDPGA